jgi:Tfp pilus assembly protein PilN
VKAVNLIPADERRGGSGTPGRSGGAVYAVLGVLGVLLIALGTYAVLSRQVADRETELAEVQAQSAQIVAQADVLRPFSEFTELSTQRVSALRTLAGARIDWSRVLEELSVALPADTRLTSMTASVAPAEGAAPAAAAPPAAGAEVAGAGGPSLQMAGCTTSDRDVADMMVRLRQMSGVRDVALASATEDETGEPVAGAPSDCRTAFDVTVMFAPLPGAAAAGVAAAAPAPAPAGAADAETDADDDQATTEGEATPAQPAGEGDDQ